MFWWIRSLAVTNLFFGCVVSSMGTYPMAIQLAIHHQHGWVERGARDRGQCVGYAQVHGQCKAIGLTPSQRSTIAAQILPQANKDGLLRKIILSLDSSMGLSAITVTTLSTS